MDEDATGGKGCGRSRLRRRESERFHSGTSSGRVRDGDGDLILGIDSLLDNRVEELE